MTYKTHERRNGGFTVIEFLIALVLGILITGALYQVLRFQQRVYRGEQATVIRHDALRLAGSVLTGDLTEATGRGGDFRAIGRDSVSVRSPVGFALVCATDPAGRRLGLFDTSGRLSATAGDSLLVYQTTGWKVGSIRAINAPGAPLSCPYASGPKIELIVSISSPLDSIPVGAPVRAFHWFTYRLEQEGDEWWLARDDGLDTELLTGPFANKLSGLTFAYFDSTGEATTNPAEVARVDLALVAENTTYTTERDRLNTSVRPRNQ